MTITNSYRSKYREGYDLMLQILWDRTNNVIQSEKDKQTLHTMIVNLMMKMNRQRWYPRGLKQIFKIYTYDTKISNWALSKKMGIMKEIIEKLNTTQKEIVEHFLD